MQLISTSTYPEILDNNKTLYHVYNISESQLAENIDVSTLTIRIIPREWNEKEIWSEYGGIITIGYESIYYDSIIFEEKANIPQSTNPSLYSFFNDPNIDDETKQQYRRIVGFTNIVRGLFNTPIQYHSTKEYVRGYIVAEHHNALAKAIMNLQYFTQEITDKIDILNELELEPDDHNAPTGYVWGEDSGNNVIYHIVATGSSDFTFYAYCQESSDTDPVFIKNNCPEDMKLIFSDEENTVTIGEIPISEEEESISVDFEIPEIEIPEIPSVTIPGLSCDFCKPIIPNLEVTDRLVTSLQLSALSDGGSGNISDVGPIFVSPGSSINVPDTQTGVGQTSAPTFNFSVPVKQPEGCPVNFGDIQAFDPSFTVTNTSTNISNQPFTSTSQITEVPANASTIITPTFTSTNNVQTYGDTIAVSTQALNNLNIPTITPNIPEISISTVSSLIASIPTSISVNMPTLITLTVQPIEITGITKIDVNVNVELSWASSVVGENTGGCFRLVPCE